MEVIVWRHGIARHTTWGLLGNTGLPFSMDKNAYTREYFTGPRRADFGGTSFIYYFGLAI